MIAFGGLLFFGSCGYLAAAFYSWSHDKDEKNKLRNETKKMVI